MKIYLVRHGQTEKNREKLLQGRSDSPLNESGIRQAEEVRDYFRKEGIIFERIYSSPLSRAYRTAEIIAPETEILLDNRLLEMDYGPYEGSSLTSPAPEITEFFSDFVNHPAPPGMESLSAVTERLGDFLRDLSANDCSGCVLVSTHAIALKGALEYLTPDSKGSWWSRYIGNCAVFETVYDNGTFSVPEEISQK